jgi:cell division protein FtsI (penicillin-binding protein 3)
MSIRKDITWRMAVVYFSMMVVGVLILVKVVDLTVIEKDKYENLLKEQTIKDFTIYPNRGDILAADGRILSSSVPYYEIRLDMKSNAFDKEGFRKNLDALSQGLSRLFGDKPARDYKRELQRAYRKGSRYYLLKRDVTYRQMKKLKQLPFFREGRYRAGLIIVQTNKRIRPQRELAARTIGYLSKGARGNVVGIEGAYDADLRGKAGVRLMQRLSGNVWMPLHDGNTIDPRDGKDVVTTLDIDIQDVAESSLRQQLIKNNADHGCVVLMEVKTGDVKAIANLERVGEGEYRETYNFAIGESVEPGSTFKLPVLIAGLEDGAWSLTDTVDTDHGKVRFYDKVIKDSHEGGYGKITVKRVLEVSSNVGMSKLVMEHYGDHPRDLIDRLYSMGLNNKLGLEIKGEGTPMIHYPGDKYWSGISLAMISHGYEVKMTPLQILTFYNAIANDGVEVKPRFVRELRYHGRTVQKFPPEVINPSICSKETLAKARLMLEGVVEDGTAKNLRNSVYKIAGKTGTAQIADERKGYKQRKYLASFVGYFPADDPRYSCIVVVSAPSNSVYYGNLVAGPVFREVADKVYATSLDLQRDYLAYSATANSAPYSKNGDRKETVTVFSRLGIPYGPDGEESRWVRVSSHDSVVVMQPLRTVPGLVPNVKGMGLKDALYLLEKEKIQVFADGWGTVKKQSVTPGSRVIPGMRVYLEMSLKK